MEKISNDKDWKLKFFKILATKKDDPEELKEADKLKIENFPPVIGKYYDNDIDMDNLKSILDGKLDLKKAKYSDDYCGEIVKIEYENILKDQLNNLMKQQVAQLQMEDPDFLKEDELEEINSSDFPFVKLMTLVYSKDTHEMSDEQQEDWKHTVNVFMNQQIVSSMINTYVTMLLHHENMYTTVFQTPYNKLDVWENNNALDGLCVVYDFKEITEFNVRLLSKIYPIVYVNNKICEDDLDYDINNIHCAMITKVKSDISEYDIEWVYIDNYEFKETEYAMMENIVTPFYDDILIKSKIESILTNSYTSDNNEDLEYDYKKLISDVEDVFDSDEFKNQFKKQLNDLTKITDDDITVDFMKPEAVYLGLEFPEDKIESFKEIVEESGVRIYKIKQSEDKLFNANI